MVAIWLISKITYLLYCSHSAGPESPPDGAVGISVHQWHAQARWALAIKTLSAPSALTQLAGSELRSAMSPGRECESR